MKGSWNNLVGILALALVFVAAAAVIAQDKAHRTLFGNRAVQRELRLSEEQQARVDAILAEMEREIEDKVKAAEGTRTGAQERQQLESRISGEAVARHGPHLQAVLNEDQALRMWQIGAQASGMAVFNNDRARRVLKLTREQMEKMRDLSNEMVAKVKQVALSPELDTATIEREAARARKVCFDGMLAVLTAEQRRDFDQLLGKPFDLELLKRSDEERPPALTFVFGLSGQTSFALVNLPETRRKLGLTDEQSAKIQPILKKADEDVTALRLKTLKSLAADFTKLELDEQRRVATTMAR